MLVVIGLSTVIAVTGGFKNSQGETGPVQQQSHTLPMAAPAESPGHQTLATLVKPNRPERREEKRTREEEKSSKETVADASQPIRIVMQIENGRVLKASVANHKPGMDSYEALALRIARQRRYPSTLSGGETVTINVGR